MLNISLKKTDLDTMSCDYQYVTDDTWLLAHFFFHIKMLHTISQSIVFFFNFPWSLTFQRGSNGQFIWVKKRNVRIPTDDELRNMMKPEEVSHFKSRVFA